MGIIESFLFLGMSIIGYKTEKQKLVNPITVFCILWSVICFFSSLGLYTITVPKTETYLIILLGTCAFIIGYYGAKHFVKKKRIFSVDVKFKPYIVVKRTKLLYILSIICIGFSLYNLINVIMQIGTLNMQEVQGALQGGEIVNHSSKIINAITFLFITPISFALPAIVAADFWNKKRDYVLLTLTIILCTLRMLMSASRSAFMLLIMFLVLATYIKYSYSSCSEKTKIKRILLSIIGIGTILLFIMTVARGHNLFRNLCLNFSMPPRMFEIWSKKVTNHNIYGYGLTSIFGLIYPLFYIIKNIFGFATLPSLIQSIYDWIMLTDTFWVAPGEKITANAYVTLYWFFYLDGRILGIFIGMLILGALSALFYLKLSSNLNNPRSLACYCMIFYSLTFSFVRLQFSVTNFFLALLFILFIAYKRNRLIDSRPRILFIDNAGNTNAGAFYSLITLIKYLREEGIECYVAIPKKSNGKNMLEKEKIPYICLTACSYSWMIDQNSSILEELKMPIKDIIVKIASIKLSWYAKKNNINIIHENTSACYIGYYVALMTGSKHIWHIREFMQEDFGKRIWWWKRAKKYMNQADAIICISDAIKEKYSKLLSNKNTFRIYNGVDIHSFLINREIMEKSKSCYLLCVGRIGPGKGQKDLILALGELKKNYRLMPTVAFAGTYTNEILEKYSKLAKELDIIDQVQFLGQVEKINELYSKTDILCMCSKAEAFGRVTVEAMLSGNLVIGSNSGGTPEILDHGQYGILYAPSNYQDLAEKIKYCINNPKEIRKTAKSGQEYVIKKFNAEKNAANIKEVYSILLKEKEEEIIAWEV